MGVRLRQAGLRLRRALAARGFRARLADPEALVHFSLLGVFAGLLAGLSIVAFRLIVEGSLGAMLPGGNAENFEALPAAERFLLVLGGALLLALLAQFIPAHWRGVGVTHVIERFNRHSGHMPPGNLAWQFVGGIIALLSGQSSGREGPTVHIGAAINSLAGRYFRLPDNSIQILVGCGTAASIAAAFGTPLAGVIFAMEVVMMEYTIAGFVPIILASATGAAVARAVFGESLLFSIAPVAAHALDEIPAVLILGLATGAAAALFVALQARAMRLPLRQPFLRILLAGAISAVVALLIPEVMGVGYDSLNATLVGGIGMLTLLALAAAKLFLSATVSGLGMPVGIIGPSLLIGGCIGGVLCQALGLLTPRFADSNSLYVLLGMVAMMGATLNAPLAALTAVMELSGSTSAMLPAMIAVISANLVSRVVFGQSSSYQSTLNIMGVNINRDPIRRTLERVGVVSEMDSDIQVLPAEFPQPDTLQRLRAASSERSVITRGRQHWVVQRLQLCELLEATDPQAWPDLAIDFAEPCCDVPAQSSLNEAWQRLQQSEAHWVCVIEPLALASVLGVIDRERLAVLSHVREHTDTAPKNGNTSPST